MAAVLEAQMAAGVFLSRHLRAGAVDVRSRGLTTSQRAAVRACVRKDPAVRLLPEGRPPHFHLDFR